MAKCCPNACGRLATAAIFISIGVVQLIAGIILFKSTYAAMLSGPNIWTASSNIVVGVVLGIASTVWKTVNKNNTRHATRRRVLGALVSSIFILNATTAAILILSEGHEHLAIYLEKGDKEILAYAYSTSVCSPIVCVVISIVFLTGICFRQKSKTIKTLDFKNILNEDSSQIYDWVYTANLPKPDPEILKAAISSESESSSSESDSDSSSDLPVPLHLRSHSFNCESLNDIKNSQHGSLGNKSLPFSATRNESLENNIPPQSIPRLKRSSLIKTPERYGEECMAANSSLLRSARRLGPGIVAYRSDCKPGTPIRIRDASVLDKSLKPGTPIRIGTSSILEKSNHGTQNRVVASGIFENANTSGTPISNGISNVPGDSTCSSNFQYNSVLSSCPKTRLSYSSISQGTPNRLQMIKKARFFVGDEPLSSLQSSMEDSIEEEDSFHGASDLSCRSIIYSPNPHSKICRTSTTDQTKVQRELENLDNSAIPLDDGATAFKEIYLDETLPEMKDKERLFLSKLSTDSGILEDVNNSLRSGGDLSVVVRNSNFRKKLSSKLVQATGPVISDKHGIFKTSNRKSSKRGRVKPYSKSKTGYEKYLQTGFSSFRDGQQEDEDDALRHNSSVNTSLMTSISEKHLGEEPPNFLPSTSTQTSGYMSASYEESDDETELKPVPLRQQPSSAQKLIADEIKERQRKMSERVSFRLDKGEDDLV